MGDAGDVSAKSGSVEQSRVSRRALHRAPVIDLALARARRAAAERPRSTLVVRVSTMKADEEVFRYFGFDEDIPLGEVQRAITTAFSLPDAPAAPAHFNSGGAGRLGAALRQHPTTLSFVWGLWRFRIEHTESHPRDAATPPAVCIAGSGDFCGTALDIAEVNRRLIGEERLDDVLRPVRGEIRDIIARSRMYDYVLLLQALDVGRGGVDKRARDVAATLPRERGGRARDAYWSVLLALACFADAETTDSITETMFRALGGGDMDAAGIRALCAGSLVRLASLGVYGPGRAAPVDRLDTFRELLRR